MDFEAWLAAMPVEEVRQRIARLEGELQFLRQLERQRTGPSPSRTDESPTRATVPQRPVGYGGRGGRLTPERRMIINAIRALGHPSPPRTVAQAIRETGQQVEDNAVQTNLSRMARYGMVQRLGNGLYDVVPPGQETAPVDSNGNGPAEAHEGVIEP